MASAFVALVVLAAACHAQIPPEPNPSLNPVPTDTSNPRLVGKAFPFNALPEQADTSDGVRGMQTGYNICNATTEGPNSLCQTLIVNSLADFCIWAPPTPNQTIGGTEEEVVAWCTQPGHGARLIPPGTLTGAQYIRTPSYIAFTGHLDQTKVDMQSNDGGGELDSGGQDDRGNPLGALAYSNTLPSSNGQIIQSRTWHMFIGNNVFCMKFCDVNAPDALGLCEHRDDTIGCNYNVPAAYQDGVFLSCLGDDQDPVGVYTTNGVVMSWNQDEGLPPPYTPKIPATSSCSTFQSAALYTAGVTSSSSSSSTTATGSKTSQSGSSSTATTSGSGASGTNVAGHLAPGTLGGTGIFAAVLIPAAAILIGAAIIV